MLSKLFSIFIFGSLVPLSQCTNYYTAIINNSHTVVKNVLRLDLENDWLATATFQDMLHETGWDFLSVRSNPKLEDDVQMFEAGFLEGYITHKQIGDYWFNIYNDFCSNKTVCGYIENMLTLNKEFIYKMLKEKPNDPVFYQTYLTYEQIRGIHSGYMEAVNRTGGRALTFHNILSLTLYEDLVELKSNLLHEDVLTIREQLSHCSALIRLLPDLSDILISHDTWTDYQTMNRMIKKYNLGVHISDNSVNDTPIVPSTISTFSGYPGSVSSIDDFYVLSSGIVALETTNTIFNNQTYGKVKPGSQIFEGIRSITSCRLASTAKEWVDYFTQYNSGTYNNQWMIIDLKNFKPGVQPRDNLFWLVETVPGYFESKDLTESLVTNFYFASYNIPYFKKINELSGNLMMDVTYNQSHQFNHELYARPMIFKRDVSNVVDLNSMLKLMRENNYKTDPYSYCPVCKPHQHPYLAIASRADLFPKDGFAKKPFINHTLAGATDCKITSWKLFSEGEILAVSGPTTSDKHLPPFSWSKEVSNISHLGQPDTWDFAPIIVAANPNKNNKLFADILKDIRIIIIESNTYTLSNSVIMQPSLFFMVIILFLQFAVY